MRFSFCTVPSQPFEELVSLVQRAESLGFARFWVPDQDFFQDPFTILGSLSQRVERIGLGLGVVNSFTRHPVQVARSAASVAKLARSSFILAYGGGNRLGNVLRLKLNPKGTAARCHQAIEIVRSLARGEELTRDEDPWPMEKVKLQFSLETPFPIYLAVRGPLMIRTAGRVADGVTLGSMAHPEMVRYAIGQVNQAAVEAGRDPCQITKLGWVFTIISDDPDPIRQRVRSTIAHSVANSPEKEINVLGIDPGKAEEVRKAYWAGGREAAVRYVTDDMIDCFSIIGTPRTVAARIRALRDAGLDDYNLLMPSSGAGDNYHIQGFDLRANVERFAQEVVPLLETA